MMNDYINLSLSFLIPTLIGLSVIKLMIRTSWPLHFLIAVSYGLGFGVVTVGMFLLNSLGISFSKNNLLIHLAIFCFLNIIFILLRKQQSVGFASKSHVTKPDCLHCFIENKILFLVCSLMILFIIYKIIFVFWRAFHVPFFYWDEISFIAFKAKFFFHKQSIFEPQYLPWPSYPLLVPLAETWTAVILGKWDEQMIKIIFPITFLAYLILHFHYLTLRVPKKWALLGICLLLSANFLTYHATLGYTDLVLLYYNCSTIILFLIWFDTKDDGFLWLAGFFAGFATFTKLEGTGYLLVHTTLLVIILKYCNHLSLIDKIKKWMKFLYPSFSICLMFHVFKLSYAISAGAGRFAIVMDTQHLHRLPLIGKELFENLFLSGNWNIVWFLFIISLLFNIERISQNVHVKILLIAIVLFFGLYISFCVCASDAIWKGYSLYNTLSRVILHFFPLSSLLIVFLNFPEQKNSHSRNCGKIV